MWASVSDLLRIPRFQWSKMLLIATENSSVFSAMPLLYSSQLQYSESISVLIDSVSGTTVERLLDHEDDVLMLMMGGSIFIVFVFVVSLVTVAVERHSNLIHAAHLLALNVVVKEQRDLFDATVLSEKTAVLAKDRFLTIVSVLM